jgi:uncharacterized protein (TIGR03437 family)
VCHKGTVGTLALVLFGVLGLGAQSATDWRRVGGAAVDLQLAGPATGPVKHVWYSADGASLYAQTEDAQTRKAHYFHTSDFESWTPVPAGTDPTIDAAPTRVPFAARLPEAQAILVASNPGTSRIFAYGRQLWGSGDGGQTWLNLTAFKAAAVIGPGQNSVAVSPNDERQVVVANDFGVWRSTDGGLSWAGMNLSLPNLTITQILSTPTGVAGTRVRTDHLGALEMLPGSSVWSLAADPERDAERAAKDRYSGETHDAITAVAASGNTVYAGSNTRIWVSQDGGLTFPDFREQPGPVQRIWVDQAQPSVALAVLSGKGPRVMQGYSFGSTWMPADGSLPEGAVYGITADRAAGAVYVATDQGVFYGKADLSLDYLSNSFTWINLSNGLPAGALTAKALDVKLDPAGVQLYAAIEDYGVFATPAPHRIGSLRIVNTADYSTRAAAPGSLLSVIGGRVSAATGENLNYPVLAAADAESQIQVPFDAQGPNVALRLVTPAGTFTRGLAVQPVSPAIIVGRNGLPMLWDADTGLPITAANGAHSNGRMQIWATGLGKVRPDWPAGLPAPADNPPVVAALVRVMLDGQQLQVTKATLVPGYIGFYLVEVQLPVVNNLGPSELYLSAGGQDSNRVQVILEP